MWAQVPLPLPQPAPLEQRLSWNGETWVGAWRQWRDAQGRLRFAISDQDLTQRLGMRLRSNSRPQEQPVVWFSPVQNLAVSWHPQFTRRYLDVTDLFAAVGWQVQVQGNQLTITAPVAQIQGIRQSARRTVVDVDRPVPYQVQTLGQRTVVRILAPGRSELRQQVADVQFSDRATVLTFDQPMQATTLPDPPRVVIEPRVPENLDIQWASGLRWRQGQVQGFPVTWLEIDPQQYTMRPVWDSTQGQPGLAALPALVQQAQGVAAINGGFFNRQTQLPLGAIRVEGQWYSSPILQRGMAAWNDRGQMVFGRAQLQEQVRVNQETPLVLQALNSGFVQRGVARYTAHWGAYYTPLTPNETVIRIEQDRVVGVVTGELIPIPLNGYLLVGRGLNGLDRQFPAGATVQLRQQLTPSLLQNYPHALGAGPLLLQRGQVVLNAEQEQFQPFFIRQRAPRSGLAVHRQGRWLWVTVSGSEQAQQGPTLTEWTRILQELGAVSALNLDGGSSTGLVLGGQVLVNGGRIHNALVLRRLVP
ncbi:MAG: phosphodiester glycosidase family protein [Gloeomargarita sp. SKYG116]|nr:phosphodiester glycosidase family protein [Gloeomargarita sp. SKYG116]MDW8402120.1 phosphodiester glycosidase family protein [Gloeomargarita sp. SKYGB_i_bin116]